LVTEGTLQRYRSAPPVRYFERGSILAIGINATAYGMGGLDKNARRNRCQRKD
jgi:hypothetical protein